jgi:hypothetical protein
MAVNFAEKASMRANWTNGVDWECGARPSVLVFTSLRGLLIAWSVA